MRWRAVNISRSLQLLARYRLIQLGREGRKVRTEPIARAVGVDLATDIRDGSRGVTISADARQPL